MPSTSIVDVLGVVAEVGQRLAGRPDRLPGLRTAAGDLGGQQVGAQQRLHVRPRLRPRDRRRSGSTPIRTVSATATAAAHRYTAAVSPSDSASKPLASR